MTTFAQVWDRILACQGETFMQVRGGSFTYAVDGDSLVPDRTSRRLPRSQFQVAFLRLPVAGPGEFQDLQGPSYLYAILTDHRIGG